jgi:hypothetical protein
MKRWTLHAPHCVWTIEENRRPDASFIVRFQNHRQPPKEGYGYSTLAAAKMSIQNGTTFNHEWDALSPEEREKRLAQEEWQEEVD